jgi:uncharacterized protein (TIGR02268 family)
LIQPFRLALALALFWGAVPGADAAPERTKRVRPVAVTGTPGVPPPEIRVEKASPTVLFFPPSVLKETLTVDTSRIQVLDAGEHTVTVQAVEDLRPGERHELAVSFADGRAPARAAFMLVTDPAEVDARIDVERREPPEAACPAEAPRDPPRPEDFVLMGYVNRKGVQTDTVAFTSDAGEGLSSDPGLSYRGEGWVLVDVQVANSAGQQPWTPREATLKGRRGVTLPARLVTVGGGTIAPGEALRVLAVADPPPPDAGVVFALQIRGDGGRTLTIPGVRFQGRLTEAHQ